MVKKQIDNMEPIDNTFLNHIIMNNMEAVQVSQEMQAKIAPWKRALFSRARTGEVVRGEGALPQAVVSEVTISGLPRLLGLFEGERSFGRVYAPGLSIVHIGSRVFDDMSQLLRSIRYLAFPPMKLIVACVNNRRLKDSRLNFADYQREVEKVWGGAIRIGGYMAEELSSWYAYADFNSVNSPRNFDDGLFTNMDEALRLMFLPQVLALASLNTEVTPCEASDFIAEAKQRFPSIGSLPT